MLIRAAMVMGESRICTKDGEARMAGTRRKSERRLSIMNGNGACWMADCGKHKSCGGSDRCQTCHCTARGDSFHRDGWSGTAAMLVSDF